MDSLCSGGFSAYFRFEKSGIRRTKRSRVFRSLSAKQPFTRALASEGLLCGGRQRLRAVEAIGNRAPKSRLDLVSDKKQAKMASKS